MTSEKQKMLGGERSYNYSYYEFHKHLLITDSVLGPWRVPDTWDIKMDQKPHCIPRLQGTQV